MAALLSKDPYMILLIQVCNAQNTHAHDVTVELR